MGYQADRRGFALPTAIGALVIVGVLVTAGFYMARQEVRIGVASRYSAMAVNLAQSGANNVLVNRVSSLAAMNTWDTTTLVDTADAGDRVGEGDQAGHASLLPGRHRDGDGRWRHVVRRHTAHRGS